MKTAIYIEDGILQLVLTPESSFEKDAIKSFSDKPLQAQIFSGSFYDCRGGWTRQTQVYSGLHFVGSDADQSLILRMGGESPKSEVRP